MKGLIRILNTKLLLVGLFSFAAVVANAQIHVSKGVQKYANKSAYETAQKQTSLRSVETPSVAMSKGVHQIGGANVEPSKGNIISKGYPYWTLSKGVGLQHLQAGLNAEYISRGIKFQ